ncbi:MAG TPA: hypothetical protein VHG91_11750 [Longimicrobium sp.]|nr:hypothetical protein [Longimicrobium sp.]
MGTHYNAIAFRPSPEAGLEGRVRALTGVGAKGALDPVGPVEIMTRDVVGVGRVGEWTVIWGEVLFAWRDSDAFAAAQERASEGGELLWWVVEDTSGGLGFTLWRDGERVREWIAVEGQVAENTGEPLPGEPEGAFTDGFELFHGPGEWTLVEVVTAVLGASWEEIALAPYQGYRV